MNAKIKYTNEHIGNPKVVADFLPRPEDLVFQDEGGKVTIALSKRSVDFFKIQAQKQYPVSANDSAAARRLCGAPLLATSNHRFKADAKARRLTGTLGVVNPTV